MDRAKIIACPLTLLLILCGCSKPAKIVVGSKNFTEQLLLGEILAQQIERETSIRVERRLNLGGTLLAQQALESGAIDLYPEYTGTALTAVLKRPPEKDPATVFEQVRADYARHFHLVWLRPFGFNNTFSMVIRREDSQNGAIATLSAAASAHPWKLGVGYEFLKRPDGFEGLVKTYGLKLDGSPITMDLGLLYTALKNGQVGMVAGNSTDGMLAVLNTVVLTDDKRYFPPYECAAVVREDALKRFPELRPALEQLSGKLPDEVMRKLNYAVDGEHRPVREVASSFIQSLQTSAR